MSRKNRDRLRVLRDGVADEIATPDDASVGVPCVITEDFEAVIIAPPRVDTSRDPDGYIDCADPETGEIAPLAYWLPDGMTAEQVFHTMRAV